MHAAPRKAVTHLSYYPLNLSYYPLNLSYCPLNLSYCPLNLSYCPLNLSYCPLNLPYLRGSSLERLGSLTHEKAATLGCNPLELEHIRGRFQPAGRGSG
jgi:hypothetical protein